MARAARELLIVGAGLTGSLTASLLSRSSVQANITVWDKVTSDTLNVATHLLNLI